MYQRGKKLLSMVLVLCMVLSLVPLTAQAALLDGADYITQQLYLGEDIVLHLRGDIPDAYKNATAVITFCGESQSCTISDLTQDENGLYDMPVTVDVAEMTENISFKATYLGLTAIEENYSVAEYLKTLIGGNYTNETKFLALELLNFGAAAQNYFDYNTNNLANAGGYEYAPSNAIPDEIPTPVQSGGVDGIYFYGASVRFLSKTAVRFYFAADSVDGLTFTVNGTQYTPASSENGYYIEVGGINPQDMETVMNVAVTNGTDTLTVEYAPISYFIRTYHNSENDEMKALAASAYSYFVAAKNFVGVTPTGDFTEGVGFEIVGNAQLFTATTQDTIIERVAYADAGVSAPANGGDYALKVSHVNNCWPNFHIDFGKTLKAGTTITFDLYGNYDYAAPAGVNKYVKLELTGDSKNFATSEDPNQVVWTLAETWNTGVTITLTADSDHIDLFYNVADGSHGDVSSWILLDNFLAIEPVEISGDILEGLDFEDAGNALWFGAVGGDVAWRDAKISIANFDGDKALKLTCLESQWPTFRVSFGKTLKAGTTITFDAYTYDTSGTRESISVFEYVSGGDATVEYSHGSWNTLTITLASACDYVDLVWNMDRRNDSIAASNMHLYLDNFLAVEPLEFTGDFETGVGLEDAGDILQFAGLTDYQAATVERVSYADTGLAAPANGGDYALKVSHANHCWPMFRVNFGRSLKAGTTVTFDLYGNYDYEAAEGVNKYMKLELAADSKSFATSEDPNQVVWTLVETWQTATITLTAETDHVDFMYNVADGQHGDVASWILMDNFEAEEKLVFTGDFETGVGLEDAGDILQFAGAETGQDATIERVTYADAGVAAPANGGAYALKASHASHCWPIFRVNFGKTLTAGTTVTFDVYGNYDYEAAEGVNKYMKLELTGDSKNYATSADPNQVVWTLVENWNTATITLTADSDHVDFFYNVADGKHGDSLASWILMDNFKAEEPVTISNGLTFENSAEAKLFGGIAGQEWRNTAIEVISFDGDNALKLSCASSAWPTFQLNFGETLKAGTTITFDFYGNYDYEAAEGVTKYVKLELYGDSKNVAESADPNQVVWTLAETWTTATITLTADCDHVEFFYNVADGSHGESPASWILLDNFVVVKP